MTPIKRSENSQSIVILVDVAEVRNSKTKIDYSNSILIHYCVALCQATAHNIFARCFFSIISIFYYFLVSCGNMCAKEAAAMPSMEKNNKQNRQHSHGMNDGIAYWIRVDWFLVTAAHFGGTQRAFVVARMHIVAYISNGSSRKINKPLVYKVSNIWSINIISMKISIWKPNINLSFGNGSGHSTVIPIK